MARLCGAMEPNIVIRRLPAIFGIMLTGAAAEERVVPAVTYPDLAAHGDTVRDFVPPGWRVEIQEQGDLNSDGLVDQILVLRDTDPANVVTHNGPGENPLDTNPRILAVAFGGANGGYDLGLENHTLIPRRVDPVMDDPIGGVTANGIEIVDGTVRVTLGRLSSLGSWEMGSSTFTFHWQDGKLMLIGNDLMTVHRSSGAMESVSINYLTRWMKQVQGRIDSDEEVVTWSRFGPAPLLRLDQVGDGLAFDAMERISQSEYTALPAQSGKPNWNWADETSRFAHVQEFVTSKAICGSLRNLEPSPDDWPDPATAASLSNCRSEELYYGIGRPVDRVGARQCALLETQRPGSNDSPFSDVGILMMIYANGHGVDRDLDLATSLACRVEGAPYAVHSRINHLQKLKRETASGQDFDYCNDITSGMAGGLCAARDAQIADAARAASIEQMTKAWTEDERRAFEPLTAAALAYAKASSENEVDLSGTLRGALVIEQRQRLLDGFVAQLKQLEQGPLIVASKEDFNDAEHARNETYRKIMAIDTGPSERAFNRAADSLPWTTVTKSGIRAAESAWVQYCDAWIRFAQIKYPAISVHGLKTRLALERSRELKALLPDTE